MIPNIFHFIFGLSQDFGKKPFSLVHYLSLKSAIILNKPDEVFFYHAYEPNGELWESIKPFLTLVKIKAPKEIFGNPITNVAHKADVIRLQVLLKYGGIYLDLDTISKKPLSDLLNNKVVIGQEVIEGNRIKGLCNAVILAEKDSKFLLKWYMKYQKFNKKYWNLYSVKVPYALSQKIDPQELRIESYESFHYPSWIDQHLKLLFEEVHDFSKAYLHHLWESFSWDKYLKELTVDYIKEVPTTYNIIARKVL